MTPPYSLSTDRRISYLVVDTHKHTKPTSLARLVIDNGNSSSGPPLRMEKKTDRQSERNRETKRGRNRVKENVKDMEKQGERERE